jgi:hypothetical protein
LSDLASHLFFLQSTGVQVAADCITEFNEFKLRNKYRYIIFHVANNQVSIEKTAAPDASYDSFLADLPADDCRYAVFNFEYDAGADGKRSKVIFILWYVARWFLSFFFHSLPQRWMSRPRQVVLIRFLIPPFVT